ncbi:DUF1707 domain-containing protein [Nonomuraea sp. 3-1Str]|uniref:DUF1707 SHOCT-like domain-containing protein n=1 Tax=Nonomuraea sp. 3-1Str TaxID=2929801 RepID=UPI002856FECC|nr:DUF1707 domain-containing protein [Nonomuraea sp. 3-1Str]MDR8409725.1 DUF1707 domain-containing protein [Nonomuraea sp. 3-1Str]
MTTPSFPSQPQVRVSDHERDKIVQRVQQAFADGRIGSGEMEERLERALTAGSHGDLTAAVADLPGDVPGEVLRLKSTKGRVRRTGDWRVPRELRIESEYGGVSLDLSQAVIEHPELDIDLRLQYGSATILLPAGATADIDGVELEWGEAVTRVPGRRRPGRLHVRVTGSMAYGRLKVRYRRAWFRTYR